LTGSYFAPAVLYCPDLVPLLFVGRQSPPLKLAVRLEDPAGMKPLAALGATVNSVSVRDNILLLAPVIHIF
jgi:hypothetical protein